MTGILRTAKEEIFSGINNLEVFTILDQPFADKFGFTESEIDQLLKDYQIEKVKDDFKSWYNGYLIGQTQIYNPWSSLSCVKRKGELRPYWVNTSNNELISKIIASSSPQIKDACATLISGHRIQDIEISDHIVFSAMKADPNSIWSLLLFSGYLTAASYKNDEGTQRADLILPNKELVSLFKGLITQLFKTNLDDSEIRLLEKALQQADGHLFSTLLTKFIVQKHELA